MVAKRALRSASSSGHEVPSKLLSPRARRCRSKFLGYFARGFADNQYCDLERNYKWHAHERWERELKRSAFRDLLKKEQYRTIAANAVAIEGRTNLLFSFEKMALRDAVKGTKGAWAFSLGLYDFLHSNRPLHTRFERWCEVVANLPRKQTRVLTWPIVTVMGFIAQPGVHFFLKPTVTRTGTEKYGLPLDYKSRPNWETYDELLGITKQIKSDLRELGPRDMIDLQSFIWISGSDEYPD